ncbi:MAG: DUF4097 domain-containing protein [Defluviitaleaceae bacterium]|nr:DUF4097 domain-containing protein [Defluviitaleaceae bacterium]
MTNNNGNEKIMILKMLEEGKITAEEAAKLLSSLGEEKKTEPNKGFDESFEQSFNEPFGENVEDFADKMENFADEMSRKFDGFAKDFEPQARNLADKIAEKISDITKSFSNGDGIKIYTDFSFGKDLSKVFEMNVENMNSILNLEGKNGAISVLGHDDGNEMMVKIKYRPKFNENEPIEFVKSGDAYALIYEKNRFKYVSVEAIVPRGMFERVKADTSNSAITANNLATHYFKADTSNSSIVVKNVQADEVKFDTSNASINLENVKARIGKADTSNAKIIVANDVDIEKFKMDTSNASIVVDIGKLSLFEDYAWTLDTSNAKIAVSILQDADFGYHFKGDTSRGRVNVGLEGMNFIKSSPTYVEAMSQNYNETRKRLRLLADTSNGSIIIE